MKMKDVFKLSITRMIFSFCVVILWSENLHAERDETEQIVRISRAVEINPTPPIIDGVLNDDTWAKTPISEGFIQREPDEGNAATEQTAFQIAYDNEAVYFAVMCYDNEPHKIVSQLTRRDSAVEADWVSIYLDPHHDHQTGYWFTVYASGGVTDGTLSDDFQKDEKWNGIWEVKTKTHHNGWAAEYRIPYHALRFAAKDAHIWGLNVERHITRKKERSHWQLIRRGDSGWISKFGHLEGIERVHPSRHLELIPYTMGRFILADENDYFGRGGMDARYGISSSTSFNGTINPDFGQVEADPARLNLSAFEDFFEERRPFFVEGASIFSNPDYRIFYSRRIGRRPGHFELPNDAKEIDRPKATTILGAAKITGKTKGKTSFGIMEAVTADEYARVKREIDEDTVESNYLIEPLTNYLVGRVNQDVLQGNSRVGFITTAVHRKNSDATYVSALDWALRSTKSEYGFVGTLAVSRAGRGDQQKTGYITHFEFDKKNSWLRGEAGFAAISPDVEINDLGFLKRNDQLRWWSDVSVRRDNPWSVFRGAHIGIYGKASWNYDGVTIQNEGGIWLWGELRNYWDYFIWFGHDFGATNDADVRRGGTLIKNPALSFVGGTITTDDRKPISFSINPSFSWQDDRRTYSQSIQFYTSIRLASNVRFHIGPSYFHDVSNSQWVDQFEEGDTVRYIYGELDSKTLDFTTRSSISFTPTLSLQVYLQPFVAIGDYENFKELVEPKSYVFRPYRYDENLDFHYRSLRSNTVLRWEFGPGSTLFIIWAQSRSASIEDMTSDDLELRPLEQLRRSFTDDGRNLFLVKVNYWIGM